MYYFYCPKCFKEDKNFNIEGIKIIYKNQRDGKGTVLNHIECPNCKSNNSAFMKINSDTGQAIEQEMQGNKVLIEGYQFSYDTNRELDIRTGKKERKEN